MTFAKSGTLMGDRKPRKKRDLSLRACFSKKYRGQNRMKKNYKLLVGISIIFICLLIYTSVGCADTTHTVKKGDTLSKISKMYYNKASAWETVYEANRGLVRDPGKIKIGWILKIPISNKKSIAKTSRGDTSIPRSINFKVTAYDLSVESCGKGLNHPQYGITRSGRSIEGKTRLEAGCVAVDPKVIPMGSLIRITFNGESHSKYNNIYQALDTGSGVKGRHVDLFLGDFRSTKGSEEACRFGVTEAKITILRKGW